MGFIRRKLIQLAIVLVVVTFFTFLLVSLLPGDPVVAILGPGVNEERRAELESELGLDDPLPIRYAEWLGDAVTGDLGTSTNTNLPVVQLLFDRLPISLLLMLYAEIIALVVAIPLGVFTAYKADSVFDKSANTAAFGLLSVPSFIAAILLIYLFALKLNWFPAIYNDVGLLEDPGEHFRQMFLPSLTLAIGLIATYTRLLRTDMLATLSEDYIGMARAKGMPTWYILFRHAFRPSSFSLLTVAGISVGQLIGGAFIVERIFGIPGIGSTVILAIFQRDFLVVQGGMVIICVGFVLVNFAVDMLYAVLDPRIRHARALA